MAANDLSYRQAVTPGQQSPIPVTWLIRKNVTIRGIANGNRKIFVDLLRAIEANGIETLVANTFSKRLATNATAARWACACSA